MGSGTYEFEIGTYIGTMQHMGTKLDSPDYDYVAQVDKVSGDAQVTISDPNGRFIFKLRTMGTFSIGS